MKTDYGCLYAPLQLSTISKTLYNQHHWRIKYALSSKIINTSNATRRKYNIAI